MIATCHFVRSAVMATSGEYDGEALILHVSALFI